MSATPVMSSGKGFVVVHVGAGYHSTANSELYKGVCRDACHQAVALLREKKSALEAVVAAICELENSPWTNAGTGSNLTLSGTVECDASIMDGGSLQYGAVGAMAGVKNPIKVAESLLQTQKQGTMSLGRIPPSTLVGEGAKQWALKRQIPLVINDGLVTDISQKNYLKHKRKLDMLEEGSPSPQQYKIRRITDSSCQALANTTASPKSCGANGNLTMDINRHTNGSSMTTAVSALGSGVSVSSNIVPPPHSSEPSEHDNSTTQCDTTDANSTIPLLASGEDHQPLDTVGAICVDESGCIASAVSSGGIVLKQPGRLGQAALYGSGCWAENDSKEKLGIGISTSGCGEHLTKTLIARECATALKENENPTDALMDVFQYKFIESRFLADVPDKLGGTLAVRVDSSLVDQQQIEVLWAHTTESMCLAFMSTEEPHPHALISRLPKGTPQGRACLVQSKVYNL